MEKHLILVMIIVSLGVTSVLSNGLMDTKATASDTRIQEDFRDLLDSIKKNDLKRNIAYRNILEQEAVRERQAFDSMKEELRSERQKNNYKQRDFDENGDIDGRNAKRVARESQLHKRLKSDGMEVLRQNQEYNLETTTVKRKALATFNRQQVVNIFPGKNREDPYSPDLFRKFTALVPAKVFKRSAKNAHCYIQSCDFRGFVRELNIYTRDLPFEDLARNPEDNADGLYYRAGFYLLLRVFNFKPTDYFDDMWQAHQVIAVETPLTVFLFAVNLGNHVDYDFNVTQKIVEGELARLLPVDSKTVLCAGIRFDTKYGLKIRHYKAVLRERRRERRKENSNVFGVLQL